MPYLPPAASSHAASIDGVMTLVHVLMLVLFVGWSAYFVYVLIRFRRSRQPRANPDGARGRFSLATEIGVVVAEAILLIVFALPLWADRTSAQPGVDSAVVVRVVAEQFAWNVHYPGADGRFGETKIALVSPTNPLGLDRQSPFGKDDIVLLSQMHLPINRPVIVQLSAHRRTRLLRRRAPRGGGEQQLRRAQLPGLDDADKASCRPDFAVLVYPAYLVTKEDKAKVSPELKITEQTPPTIIAMTQDDPIGIEGVYAYALAMKNVKVPCEVHVYPVGGHGYGLRPSKNPVSTAWPLRVAEWMEARGLLKPGASAQRDTGVPPVRARNRTDDLAIRLLQRPVSGARAGRPCHVRGGYGGTRATCTPTRSGRTATTSPSRSPAWYREQRLSVPRHLRPQHAPGGRAVGEVRAT